MGADHSLLHRSSAAPQRERREVPPAFQSKALLKQLNDKPNTIVKKSFSEHHTIWHEAAEKGYTQALVTLAHWVNDNARDLLRCSFVTSKSLKPLRDRSDLLRLCVNQTNAKGQTPLMYAAYNKQEEAVQVLMSIGADAWATDKCGSKTALHYAAMAGSAPCIQALLEGLEDGLQVVNGRRYVDCRSVSGLCALHYAIDNEPSHVEAVQMLLRYNANIFTANVYQSHEYWLDIVILTTPLHLAAARGCDAAALEVLKFYISRRDTGELHDPRMLTDCLGRMPFQIAAARKHRRLAEVLHPAGDLTQFIDTSSIEQFGAPTLKIIAGKAIRAHLLMQLHEGEVEPVAAPSEVEVSKASGKEHIRPDDAGMGPAEHAGFALGATSSDMQGDDGAGPSGCNGSDNQGGSSEFVKLSAVSLGSRCSYEACGVCFEAVPDATICKCGHQLCSLCASSLCMQIKDKPALCPFCRGIIAGFEVH